MIDFLVGFLLNWILFFLLFFLISFIIYTFFQYKYYVLNADNYLIWSVNARKSPNLTLTNHWCQILPFRNKKSPNSPQYFMLYSLHTMLVIAFQFSVSIQVHSVKNTYISTIIMNTLLLLTLIHFSQYIEHKIMHKFLYKYHKYHHHFKNPEPWDGYYVHPIEMYINLLIFFFPCLLMHKYVGLIEVLIVQVIFYLETGFSHTGVKTGISFLDTMSTHHELHHMYSDCNYGTLSTLCDTVFGTLYKKY